MLGTSKSQELMSKATTQRNKITKTTTETRTKLEKCNRTKRLGRKPKEYVRGKCQVFVLPSDLLEFHVLLRHVEVLSSRIENNPPVFAQRFRSM